MTDLKEKTNKILPLLLVIAVLCLFWPALLQPRAILTPNFSPFSDALVIHWPKAHLMAQHGPFPFWTPLILSGMPLAANQLAMLFYPPAWLFFLLPIELVFNLLAIFHLIWGGLGVYLLLRKKHQLARLAALLGALTYSLNGKWLAHLAGGHVSMVGAIAWLPWLLFGTLMLLQSPRSTSSVVRGMWNVERGTWVLLTVIALAMQIVTHTLLVIYSVYLIAAAVLWHLALTFRATGIAGVWNEIKQLFLPLLTIPLWAGLLGAAQLLPLAELAGFSNRALSLEQAALYAVSLPQLLMGLLLPSAQAGHELVIYLGLIPLLLIPVGLTRRQQWTWFYGGLLIFTILFAMGPTTPVHTLFYTLAPGFRWVRTPARMFFVGSLVTSALVGLAVEQLDQGQWSRKTQQRLTLLAVLVGGVTLLLGLGLAFAFGLMGRAAFALAFLVPLGLAVIILRGRHVISGPIAATALGLLLFVDLASFDLSLMKFISLTEALAPSRPTAEYLARQPGHARIYSPSYSLPMQTAAAYNLHLADGVEPVHLAGYDTYMARAGGYNDASFSVTIPHFGNGPLESVLQNTEPNLKLLGLLNVRYLASAFPMAWSGLELETQIDDTFVYTNKYQQPPAWVVHQTSSPQTDWLSQLAQMPDVANVALVEGQPQLTSNTPASPVTITNYGPNIITLQTSLTEAGWLIMSELWYPGWQATVNGSPRPVEKVNGIFRGIYLAEPGQYEIAMIYQSPIIVWGTRLSLLGGVVVVIGGILMWKQSHRKNSEPCTKN